MNSLTRKLATLIFLSAVPLAIVVTRSFVLTRRGWHTPEIQFQVIYWFVRAALAPALLLFIVRNWIDAGRTVTLTIRLLSGFIVYTAVHWGLSFTLSKILMPTFDPRSWNLFNIIKNESSLLNFVLYFGSVLILYLWVYVERERTFSIQSANLKIKLAQFEGDAQSRLRAPGPVMAPLSVITVKNGSKVTLIQLEKILFLQANGPYVSVNSEDSTRLLNKPLYELQATLPGNFLRVHRSYIVNLHQIAQTKSLLNGDYELTLKTGRRIRASRTYREHLRTALGNL